jgi:hypothetical protein
MANDSDRHWYKFVDNGCVFGLVGSVLLLVNQYISKNVEPLGVYSGIPAGILGGVSISMIWGHYAKKGRFILGGNEDKFRFRIWHFGLVFALGAIIGLILIELSERYPEINVLNLITTFLIFGFASFFSVGLLAVYWLQWHYGKRFYLVGQEG